MMLPSSSMCTGCKACEAVCSKNAVKLQADKYGFFSAQIEISLCAECGRCAQVCPVLNNKNEKQRVKQVFALSAKDRDLEEQSSSGGAFSLLAQKIVKSGGVVYAAGFDENFRLTHIRIDNTQDLEKVRGSKYVQSLFIDSAFNATEDLKNGLTVLFVGTPCQIAALKNILPKSYTGDLYCVDFICHGVTSPKLFEKYKDFVREGKEIRGISFRDKTEGWRRYSMKMSFSDGTAYRKPAVQDLYLTAYAQNISVRESCTDCAFLGEKRLSDLTLGDAWSQKLSTDTLCDGRGVSLVLVNSEKGNSLFNSVKEEAFCEELSTEVLKSITPLNKPTPKNPLKESFYKDSEKLGFDKLWNKYCSMGVGARLRRFAAKKLKVR